MAVFTPIAGVRALLDAATTAAAKAALTPLLPATVALMTAGVPDNGDGANGDYRIDGLTGVIYQKALGIWEVIAPSGTQATFYPLTGVPDPGFGDDDDTGVVYDAGFAVSLVQKIAGAWEVLASFAEEGLTLGEVVAAAQTTALQRWQCFPHDPYASGANAAVYSSNGVGCQGSAGSTTAGFARHVLASTVTGFPGATGTGINFSRPMALECYVSPAATAAANGGRLRFVFGDVAYNISPPGAQDNALSARGFGVEFGQNGGVLDCRIFVHDGTTYQVSSWFGAVVGESNRPCVFRLESDGAGLVSLFIAPCFENSGPKVLPSVASLTRTGGPTSTSANGNVSALAVASTAGAPANNSITYRVASAFITVQGA